MFDHQSSATVMNVFMNSTIAILVHCREHVFTIFISKRWKTESESAIIGFVLMSFCKLWVGGLTNLSCSHICCFMMNGQIWTICSLFRRLSEDIDEGDELTLIHFSIPATRELFSHGSWRGPKLKKNSHLFCWFQTVTNCARIPKM